MPSLNGFNFVMKHALGGGATMSLRLDSLGKSMGSAVTVSYTHLDVYKRQAGASPTDPARFPWAFQYRRA